MRPIPAAVALLLACAAPSSAHPAVVDREAVLQQIQSISQQLATLHQQLEELERQVRRAPAPYAQPIAQPPPPPPPSGFQPVYAGRRVIEDSSLQALVAALRNTSYSSDRANILASAAISWFTVDQVAAILPAYAYSSERLRALEVLVPRIVDRHNGFKLYPLLQYAPERNRLKQLLEAPPAP